MNAARHYAKAEAMETSRARLDPVADTALVVEGYYMSAHHFIEAGADWHDTPHPTNHAHNRNPQLLKQAGAPADVSDAWALLERLRAGNVYGGHTNGNTSANARTCLMTIKAWAMSSKP